ncbi:MAG TPA: M42 family metallopeptidase [Candidatus Nitrosocosmicus sp.]|nr:M42 family metallopeptidase [Candidatus Nitrosocosmicus sp.]
MIDTSYILEVMQKLCSTASPTGFTEGAFKLLESEFQKLGMPFYYTNKGSMYSYIAGKNTHVKKALAAHTDTLGAMVKEIKANGRLVFSNVGGYAGNSVECENCLIHTVSGKTYSGTIYTTKPSVHVHGDVSTFERTLENMEIVLDEKVFSVQDVKDLGIEIGDFISFDSRFKVTASGFVKSRHLDDKAGVSIILGVCKYIKDNNIVPENTVQIFITNYEEVGHGACSGIDSEALELLCVDMGAMGIGQNTDEYSVSICAKDSSGPYDYKMRTLLVELAKKNGIDYKIDLYPRYTSDASTALKAGMCLRTGLIGPGVFASHSYERTHVDSLKATAELLLAYVRE